MQTPRDEQVRMVIDRDRWIIEALRNENGAGDRGPLQFWSSKRGDGTRKPTSSHAACAAFKEHVRDYCTLHPVLYIHQFTQGKAKKWQTNILWCQTSKILRIIPPEFSLSTGWIITAWIIWFLSMLPTRGEHDMYPKVEYCAFVAYSWKEMEL